MDGRYHCELAWLGGDAAAAGVVVDVAGGVITSVTTGVAEPPAGAVRLAGLTLPGLANAHSHAFHRALRGRTQFQRRAGTGSFWTWREQMYAVAEALTPESYLALARAVYGEMVLAGITAVGEFHYLHHDTGRGPLQRPERDGSCPRGSGRRRRAAADAARHVLPPRWVRRRARGRAAPVQRRHGRRLGRAGGGARRRSPVRTCGSAPRSTRCGPSTRPRWRWWRRGPTSAGHRSTPTCPSSRPRTATASRPTA